MTALFRLRDQALDDVHYWGGETFAARQADGASPFVDLCTDALFYADAMDIFANHTID